MRRPPSDSWALAAGGAACTGYHLDEHPLRAQLRGCRAVSSRASLLPQRHRLPNWHRRVLAAAASGGAVGIPVLVPGRVRAARAAIIAYSPLGITTIFASARRRRDLQLGSRNAAAPPSTPSAGLLLGFRRRSDRLAPEQPQPVARDRPGAGRSSPARIPSRSRRAPGRSTAGSDYSGVLVPFLN